MPCSTATAAPLVEDDRIKLLTFTGSPAVGWGLKARAGRKRVTLELGGNAAVIVNEDADVDYAVERIVWGGFAYAGQTCISVQRVYVHSSLYDAFAAEVVRRVSELRTGDPLDESTDVGPLIDAAALERVEEWIAEARDGGAEVLAGGERDGTVWRPTVLAGLRDDMRVSCEEVFAPVIGLEPFDDVAAGDRRGSANRVRSPGRSLHERHARRRRRVRPDRGRRPDGERRLDVPHRPHAVRRREELRASDARACATRSRR